MKKGILTVCAILFVFPCFGKSIAYNIGTTGYMIREARMANASELASEDYKKALQYQLWAKQALYGEYVVKKDGTSKKIRSKALAKEFTQKAYDLAKATRDQSLKVLGKKF